MKKKDIKKLNSALLDSVDVPDSVLDAARQEMANSQPETVSSPSPAAVPAGGYGTRGAKNGGGTIAVNRKLIAICCACAVLVACIAVVIIIVTSMHNSFNTTSDITHNYKIAELDVQEITSLTEYNEENGTSYIGVNFDGVITYQYSNTEDVVLFAQVFTYENAQYIWYIAVDENIKFDILQDYIDTTDTVDVSDFTVYLGNEPCYAKFYAEGSAYYLTGGTDSTAVIEILQLIVE